VSVSEDAAANVAFIDENGEGPGVSSIRHAFGMLLANAIDFS
jgi:hypothetical protein